MGDRAGKPEARKLRPLARPFCAQRRGPAPSRPGPTSSRPRRPRSVLAVSLAARTSTTFAANRKPISRHEGLFKRWVKTATPTRGVAALDAAPPTRAVPPARCPSTESQPLGRAKAAVQVFAQHGVKPSCRLPRPAGISSGEHLQSVKAARSVAAEGAIEPRR